MTTEFIKRYLPETEHSNFTSRALAVARVWPEVRAISDDKLEEALFLAQAELKHSSQLVDMDDSAMFIVPLLYRTIKLHQGFDIGTQYLAASSNFELLTRLHLSTSEIKIINHALESLHRD